MSHFFLSVHKKDFWDIGGNDEDFLALGFEDTMLAVNLTRNYKVNYLDDAIGHHQPHSRNCHRIRQKPFDLFKKKVAQMSDVSVDYPEKPPIVTVVNDVVGVQTFVI